MSARGRQMLQEIYHAPPTKIDLIQHGIPMSRSSIRTISKEQFGVERAIVLFTSGCFLRTRASSTC